MRFLVPVMATLEILRFARVSGPALALAACAGLPAEPVRVTAEAKGSAFFSLGAPTISKTGAGQHLAGRVCRLGRSTLLSPPRIRVEHRAADGQLRDVAQAHIPEIYLARDQTCSDYAAKVAWSLAEGDVVRACFDRGLPCPAQAESKAVIKAPASP